MGRVGAESCICHAHPIDEPGANRCAGGGRTSTGVHTGYPLRGIKINGTTCVYSGYFWSGGHLPLLAGLDRLKHRLHIFCFPVRNTQGFPRNEYQRLLVGGFHLAWRYLDAVCFLAHGAFHPGAPQRGAATLAAFQAVCAENGRRGAGARRIRQCPSNRAAGWLVVGGGIVFAQQHVARMPLARRLDGLQPGDVIIGAQGDGHAVPV